MKNFIQQPTPVPPQVEIPQEFPEIPQAILDRFPEAADWQRRLDDFWTRTNQAIQQAQDQTAKQVNSNVVFNVDSFLIYANGVPTAMFALDASGVRLGNVLVINTPGNKVYIGAGELANDNTPFYIDTLGNFSLGASLVWDPVADTLTITGIINATSGTIGGFTIGVDYIRDAANSFGLASTVTGGDDIRFWAGTTFANRANAPFRVKESGNIFANSGTIGGFTLSSIGMTGGKIFSLVPDMEPSPIFGISGTIVPNSGSGTAMAISSEFVATANGDAFYGAQIEATVTAAAFTNVDAYGLFLGTLALSGTIRNAYGLYITPPAGTVTNKYGIYVQGSTSRNIFEGSVEAWQTSGIPAGGTAGKGYLLSSTANFGVFFGSGAPSLSAAKGSLYLRSDGSGTNDRAYINTNGSTTWTAIVTVA